MSAFGTPYKQCHFNYQWFPAGPWGCAKTTCDKPLPSLTNGKLSCTSGNQAKSVCTGSCDPGFLLVGNAQVTCAYSGLDLDWSGDTAMTCVKLPCEKMIDLRTGRTEGFTGGNDDFAVLFSAPYRGRMDNSYDPYMGSNPCNMKVVVGIKDARNADVKVDVWYDHFPSQYHFDFADDMTSRFSYSRDELLGFNKRLMTNVMMRSSNNSQSSIVGSALTSYFEPNLHSTYIIGQSHIEFNNNRGVSGKVGPSQYLGGDSSEKQLYLGLNRMVNANWNNYWRVGSGVCRVCINRN